ncbi:unnamed protein product [Cyprideis torosa]|uniref:Uncharacterized protein n=1 Tax=Cyprideis torosa TaxID=163714 RepID=A0A7R8WIU6_9CRUS|nr:unnamed protein product [Cyprideis torosa]CAG0901208.1 unnamed protein product [Cyprideis torosa]
MNKATEPNPTLLPPQISAELSWQSATLPFELRMTLPFLLCCTLCSLHFAQGDIYHNLRHFEFLDAEDIGHHIVKRGATYSAHPYNSIKEVAFKTLGRKFRLMLSPKKGLLHPLFKAVIVDSEGKEVLYHVDQDSFFEGRVFGEKGSHVTAHIEDGVLTASIETEEESYHIEPSWRHLPDGERNKTMIAYKEGDINFSWENRDHPDGPVIMAQQSAVPKKEPPKFCGYDPKDTFFPVVEEDKKDNRSRREADQQHLTQAYTTFQHQKTRCPLLLVADYRFFREMGHGQTKTTIDYLISLIDRVHKIYAETEWKDATTDKGFSGMGFVIKKILVHSEPTRVAPGELHYNMERATWDVRSLLEVFSRQYSHKDYCLAHLFTDIKFEGGILGLAYVGSPRRNSVGGICTPEYFKNGYTLYLNSGLSSSRNHYGQRVIMREADLVTAHEFGHNWGSEHDPDLPECSPKASEGGSYLMYTYSVSGYDYNNKKFSPCSLRSIRSVLLTKSSRCFTEPEESFCGNLRVEKGEECDAGLVGTEGVDSCCDANCKLRKDRGAKCSDKNSPCCDECQFIPIGKRCREAQYATCAQEAQCTGRSADCPPSPPLPDGTPCIEKGKCQDGKCLPFCESQAPALQSCMCDVLENACKRCCRRTLNDTCFLMDPNDTLPNGTPCMVGYCRDGKCEKTVQDIVERFWDIIDDINVNSVMSFLRDNIVGTVVIASLVVWIPASCLISFIDKRRRREFEKLMHGICTAENDRITILQASSNASSMGESGGSRRKPQGRADAASSPVQFAGGPLYTAAIASRERRASGGLELERETERALGTAL